VLAIVTPKYSLLISPEDKIMCTTVDHVLCQIFQLWRFRLVCPWQLMFLPAKYDSNNSVQFNAFASKAATNAVIVGTSVMIENFLMSYFQSIFRA